ncbi:MAG: hypothetical protein KAX37_02685 [Opitutaceae bacterium]|nr:hypothetical protein [Opitutaceae bacterium]
MNAKVGLEALKGITPMHAKAAKHQVHPVQVSQWNTFVIFATASLIGEGFDLPRLDTPILTMPLSFKGRLIQYAGRLNRVHESKNALLIFDCLDEKHALTNAMFRRRLAGYTTELGYQVEMPQDAAPVWFEAAANNAE